MDTVDLLDTPYLAKKTYWSLDAEFTDKRQAALLRVLKLVCETARTDVEVRASAALLSAYDIPH